jgi:hypothetical protein
VVAKSWWNAVTIAGGALGILSGASQIEVPWWLWLGLIIVGLTLAQVQVALRGPRASPQEDVSPTELGARGGVSDDVVLLADETPFVPTRAVPLDLEAVEAPVRAETPELDPLWLRGRVLPYHYAQVVSPTETALPIRVAVAARVSTGNEPEPAKSWIVTLRRPGAPMQMQTKWTLDAQAQINLRPVPVHGRAGWMTLILDVVLRPTIEVVERGRPLSLEELFQLIYVISRSTQVPAGGVGSRPRLVVVFATTTGRSPRSRRQRRPADRRRSDADRRLPRIRVGLILRSQRRRMARSGRPSAGRRPAMD